MVDFRELPIGVRTKGVKPWKLCCPLIRVNIDQEPAYTERVIFSFTGAVGEIQFDIVLRGKYGSRPPSLVPRSSAVPSSVGSGQSLKSIPENIRNAHQGMKI